MAQAEGRTGDNRPDFIRYYLQFPPVTRTLLTAIVLISTLVHFGIISKYTLFASFWGSLLRFFDAGWGLWFLMTLIICMNLSPFLTWVFFFFFCSFLFFFLFIFCSLFIPLVLLLGARELMVVYQQSSQVEGYFSTPDYAWMLVLSGATIMVNYDPLLSLHSSFALLTIVLCQYFLVLRFCFYVWIGSVFCLAILIYGPHESRVLVKEQSNAILTGV